MIVCLYTKKNINVSNQISGSFHANRLSCIHVNFQAQARIPTWSGVRTWKSQVIIWFVVWSKGFNCDEWIQHSNSNIIFMNRNSYFDTEFRLSRNILYIVHIHFMNDTWSTQKMYAKILKNANNKESEFFAISCEFMKKPNHSKRYLWLCVHFFNYSHIRWPWISVQPTFELSNSASLILVRNSYCRLGSVVELFAVLFFSIEPLHWLTQRFIRTLWLFRFASIRGSQRP